MTVKHPILRYHGSKWRISPWIIDFFPPHKVYVEPYGGGASVLLRKAPAITEVYNDLDGSVVNLMRVIRDPAMCERLANRLEATPYSRTEFNDAYEEVGDPVEDAARLCIRSFLGQSSKGIWMRSGFDTRINPDGYCGRLNAFRRLPAVLSAACRRLFSTVIENDDAIAVIERSNRSDALIYCDPPYHHSTHASRVYRHRADDEHHAKLADALRRTQAYVIVSGYASDAYDELFEGWERRERQSTADTGKKSVECVWLNPKVTEAQRQQRLIA